MTIESPLKRYAYEAGRLVQACPACDWAQDGHRKELTRCPLCNADLGDFVAIYFGGLIVIFTGANFEVHDNTGSAVNIERADYADVIAFMCRHGVDLRADVWATPRIRRIHKAKEFDKTCLDAWRRQL